MYFRNDDWGRHGHWYRGKVTWSGESFGRAGCKVRWEDNVALDYEFKKHFLPQRCCSAGDHGEMYGSWVLATRCDAVEGGLGDRSTRTRRKTKHLDAIAWTHFPCCFDFYCMDSSAHLHFNSCPKAAGY